MAAEGRGARPGRVGEAIQQVLESEAKAAEQIALCRKQARDILETARLRARTIESRTDARIVRVHSLCDAALERTIREIKIHASAEADVPDTDSESERRLMNVIEEMADELIGGQV